MEALFSCLNTTEVDIPSSLSLHRKSTRIVSSYQAISNSKPHARLKYPATPIISAPTWCKYRAETRRLPQNDQMVRQQRSSMLSSFSNPSIRPSLDPKHVLSNNYAPVSELPPTACLEIEGNLPPCLNGAYLRNGPNPQYPPQSPYHLFDGDGMVHCLRISNGHATLCSRYVKTYKYSVERDAGRPVFPHILSGLISGLLATFTLVAVYVAQLLHGKYNPKSNGVGPANTSLAYFGGKLFTLGESDLPYQIQITPAGDIETVGRYDFEESYSSSLGNMTAHPKLDPQTGETFAYRCSVISPYLIYFRLDKNGSKQPNVPIYSLLSPTWIHDFAITEKYATFVDNQMGVTTNLFNIIAGSQPLVGADPSKVSRIGVIPRYATNESEMRWFNLPGFNIVHALNAWDEEDSIVLLAPNISPVEHLLEEMNLVYATVEKVRINLKTGTVTRSIMSSKNLEFGVINPAFTGRKNKYGYLAVGNQLPDMSGVVKLDWSLEEGRDAGCRMFEKGCFGGEPFYVPKRNNQTSSMREEEEEDDGYLVMYVHNENTGESKFLVMDAKSPTLDIVAAVKLPARVPYGFHGLFVRECNLLNL